MLVVSGLDYFGRAMDVGYRAILLGLALFVLIVLVGGIILIDGGV